MLCFCGIITNRTLVPYENAAAAAVARGASFFAAETSRQLPSSTSTSVSLCLVLRSPAKMSGRKDFLSQPAPENYVAGLGRGATGFTTRSDLGPAREGPTPEQIQEALAKRAQLLGTAPPTAYGAGREKGRANDNIEEDDDDRFQDPENEVGLFAYGQWDREDDEADRIYKEVDEKMDRRRKARRLVFPVIPPSLFHLECFLFIGFSPSL